MKAEFYDRLTSAMFAAVYASYMFINTYFLHCVSYRHTRMRPRAHTRKHMLAYTCTHTRAHVQYACFSLVTIVFMSYSFVFQESFFNAGNELLGALQPLMLEKRLTLERARLEVSYC